MTVAPTDLQLIDAYISRRNHVDALNKLHAEKTKPFTEQMKTIENEMLRRLIERGADNSATDAGTAYKEQTMSVKCEDKDAMLKFAINKFDTIGKDLLTAAVSKDTVKVYIEQTKSEEHPNGLVPPGLKVEFITNVKFRKA